MIASSGDIAVVIHSEEILRDVFIDIVFSICIENFPLRKQVAVSWYRLMKKRKEYGVRFRI